MKHKRNVYLNMKPLDEARQILFERFRASDRLTSEVLSVLDAAGRVLSAPVTAKLSSPNHHVAAMDGIAVKAERTFDAHESTPQTLAVGEEAHYVNTGHIMPEGCDAVIMIEHVQVRDEEAVVIEAPAFPWQNVRKMGEDIVATELLFPQNHLVTPYCIGALLTAGIYNVSVWQKPRVLIVPTGSELMSWQDAMAGALRPGQVIETNSFVLGSLTESWGGSYRRHDIVEDSRDTIRQTLMDPDESEYDILMTVGGSSAGSEVRRTNRGPSGGWTFRSSA